MDMWTPFKWLWGHRDCETVSGYPRGEELYTGKGSQKVLPSGLTGAAHTLNTQSTSLWKHFILSFEDSASFWNNFFLTCDYLSCW